MPARVLPPLWLLLDELRAGPLTLDELAAAIEARADHVQVVLNEGVRRGFVHSERGRWRKGPIGGWQPVPCSPYRARAA